MIDVFGYDAGMASRTRPVECCSELVPPVELAPSRRDRLVAVYRALGDPTRLEVLRLIAAQTAPLWTSTTLR